MEKAKLAILEAELSRQKQEIDKIYAKIDERRLRINNETGIESLAYQLHNLYCAYEDLFKIVAAAFENNIEEGITWHKELLRRMTISIKGIRPNLISEKSMNLLSELRSFRHFFRHAYGYELDPGKVKLVLEKAAGLKEAFTKDVNKFLSNLKSGKT